MLHIMSLTEFEHIREMDRRCLKMPKAKAQLDRYVCDGTGKYLKGTWNGKTLIRGTNRPELNGVIHIEAEGIFGWYKFVGNGFILYDYYESPKPSEVYQEETATNIAKAAPRFQRDPAVSSSLGFAFFGLGSAAICLPSLGFGMTGGCNSNICSLLH